MSRVFRFLRHPGPRSPLLAADKTTTARIQAHIHSNSCPMLPLTSCHACEHRKYTTVRTVYRGSSREDCSPERRRRLLSQAAADVIDCPQWIAAAKSDGKRLVVPTLHPINLIRLRESCSCPRCVDPSSGQREFRLSDIPEDIDIDGIDRDGYQMVVRWKNDIPGYDDGDHTSAFTLQNLTDMHEQDNRPKFAHLAGGPLRIPWNREIMERNQHWVAYNDYMNNHGAFRLAMRSLCRYGLFFVHGIPEDEQSVERITTRMGPLRNTFYGLTWDVRSKPDAENVAYTNKFLGFHMDLMYMENPPAYQVLHCMRNSLAGGESLFSDAHLAIHRMRTNRYPLYTRLATIDVPYGYYKHGQHYEKSRPVVHRPNYFKPNFFTDISYSPPFQLPMKRLHTDPMVESQMLEDWLLAMKILARELEAPQNMFELKLQPGQCVIFDNRRVVHARRGFNLAVLSSSSASSSSPPDRWLRGAYVDRDPLDSHFRQLREEDPASWDATQISDGMSDAIRRAYGHLQYNFFR